MVLDHLLESRGIEKFDLDLDLLMLVLCIYYLDFCWQLIVVRRLVGWLLCRMFCGGLRLRFLKGSMFGLGLQVLT